MGEELDRDSIAKAYARWAPIYDLVFGSVFERGRKAAIWAIIGFGSVLFTFLGVNYILPELIPELESLHIYAD